MVRYKLKIFGRVQGVGFRNYAKVQARSLGVTGWVRNLEDGTVECEVQANKGKLKELFKWVKKGNSASRVDDIDVKSMFDSV